jgi:hypothetical protein
MNTQKIRELTTCENRGTQIIHNTVGTQAEIVGSYKGGFIVLANGAKFKLPFSNTQNWSVTSTIN